MSTDIEILVIDDEIPSLRLLTELLERDGYRVRTTGNAQQAIESALARPPALIISDVRMPEIDGFQVCRRLKEDERTRGVPVIFISSLQDTDARVQGFEAGGVDFVTKPFQEQEVLARVRTHTLPYQMQQHLEQIVEERTAELRKSEERYELAVAGSAAGIWDWDVSSGTVFFSGRFKELLGYAAEEPWSSTDDFWERLHPDDEQAVREALHRHLENRTPYREDFRLKTRSGKYRWFYARGQALWDKVGKPVRMAGSISDITHRKVAEEQLRKSEERYELVVKASGVGLWDWEIQSGKVYLSDRAKGLLGYLPREDWNPIDEFWGMIHPDDLQGVKEAVDRHFESRVPYDRDYRYLTKPGEYRWFNVRGQSLWDETGKPFRSVGSIADITERKLAQEKIVRSERRFRSLMEQSPLAIVLHMPDGRIAQVNSAWKKLWGFDDDGVAEMMKTYNLLDDDQARDLGWTDLIEKGFAGEKVVLPPIEYIGQQTVEKLGVEGVQANTVWIQCHLSPIRNEEQEIEYIVSTVVDVTALKKGEEESLRQRETLARVARIARMEQMTGSIAHELNQPLTGILSSAQAGELAIGKGECDHDEMSAIMGEIVADAKRASEVIRGLREIYREQKEEHGAVDINALVAETKQLLHSEFIMQKVELTTEYSKPAPMVSGNRVQIQQVLVNLVLNAAEAMRDAAQDSRHIHVVTACEANEVKVWVEDSGPGIDDDKIDTIFEPLATWKPGGTGMGLAISNSIIEAHRGKIWAENRPGGGARVGCTLPVLNEESEA